MKEAQFWSVESDKKVRCLLCPHQCLVADGKTGICRVRKNISGQMYSMVYGHLAAIHSDPVEKKPLYHFYPGHRILSTGTFGCNLHCTFCQNYDISQNDSGANRMNNEISPRELAEKASQIPGNLGIAYTYNEPTVFFEFMLDTAFEIKTMGLKNAVISNGFILPGPLEKLLPFIDAFNIDLKSFSDGFYRKMTGGSLDPVLGTLKAIVKAGKHLEITLLVIPSLNDSAEEFSRMTDWIRNELGPDIPLHLSRYFPSYKLSLPPTPMTALLQFAGMAREKLNYVYTGNISIGDYSSTFCPRCKAELIRRESYEVTITGLTSKGLCSECGEFIPIWT